ncbi:MAG: RidA family protein [Gammaproteobacteria bacterium]|nr:RidA family protein [Gammaproteobacteria bacterium]
MQIHQINPWDWSLSLGYSQAVIIPGGCQQLHCAGQTSVDARGQPLHEGDMGLQITQVLNNLQALLASAQMTFADVCSLRLYSTDVSQTLNNYGLIVERFTEFEHKPAMTLVEVSALAIPSLLIEIDAVAAV